MNKQLASHDYVDLKTLVIEGEITSIQNDIIDLQGDISDIQGDITSLSGDVSSKASTTFVTASISSHNIAGDSHQDIRSLIMNPASLSGYASLSGANFTGNITATNLSGINTGDQDLSQIEQDIITLSGSIPSIVGLASELFVTTAVTSHNAANDSHQDIRALITNPSNLSGYALLSGANFTGNIYALNLSGVNTGDQDLSSYATQAYVTSSIAAIPTVDLSPYATLSGSTFLGNITAANLSGINTGDQDLASYATLTNVTESISGHNVDGSSHQDIRSSIPSIAGLASEVFVTGAVSSHNVAVDAHQDIRNAIPSIVGLASEVFVTSSISSHNIDNSAHQDIRSLIPSVSGKVDILNGYSINQSLSSAQVTDHLHFAPITGVTSVPEGQLLYNSDQGTISFGVLNGSIELGKETFDYFTNNSGVTLLDGDVVSVCGVAGNRQAVCLTDIRNPVLAASCIGMVTDGNTVNQKVRVTKIGRINNLNTDAYVEGTTLYVSTSAPGKLTQTPPLAPNAYIVVGVVTVKHQNVGAIDVDIRISPRLEDLSDVDGVPLTTTGQFPVWHQELSAFDFDYNINSYAPTSSLIGLATETFVTSSISNHNISATAHTDIRNSVTNVSNSLSSYALNTTLSNYAPISGVNFTGNITATNLSGVNTGDQDLSSYALTSQLIGLASETFVTGSVSSHNIANDSHVDIRNSVTNVSNSLSSYALETFVTSSISNHNVNASAHTDIRNSVTNVSNSLSSYATLSGATFTGNITATNLSGINTGDQNLESYKTYAGFENRTDSTISIDANGVFTLSGASFNVYTNGTGKHTLTGTQTVTAVTDQTLSYVYIDDTGTLQIMNTPWDIADGSNIPCAIVFKDGTSYALTDERHSFERNRSWHKWAHFNIGAMYNGGLTGTFGDATVSITQGAIADEDIIADTGSTQTATTLWYRNGTTGMRIIRDSNSAKGLTAGSILAYDDNSGTLAAVDNNKYVTNWVYASNDATQPIYTVVGQNNSTLLTTARNAAFPTINLSTAEWKLIYRVIYQRTAGVPTGVFVEATDFRTVQTGIPTAAVSTDHASLLNRDAANSHPATAISYGATNVDAALTTLTNGLSAYSTTTSTTLAISSHNISNVAHQDIRGLIPSITGLASETFVTSSVSSHNVNGTAHSDIRGLIPSIAGLAYLSGATFTGNITALNLSGTNTGDQNLAPYALNTSLSNYAPLSGATFTGNITASNLSGVNTGDQNLAPYALNTTVTNLSNSLSAYSTNAYTTSSISDHNTSSIAHVDIRNSVTNVSNSLSSYATQAYVTSSIAAIPSVNLAPYATLSGSIFTGNITAANLSGVNTGDQNLAPYALQTFVSSSISSHNIAVDAHQDIRNLIPSIAGLATETFATNTVTAHNVNGTAHQDIRNAIPSIVGLATETFATNTVTAHNVNASAHQDIRNAIPSIVGLATESFATASVTAHNVNGSAHSDIRGLIPSIVGVAYLSGATFTGNITALNLSGTNTGDQNLAPYALSVNVTSEISAHNTSGTSHQDIRNLIPSIAGLATETFATNAVTAHNASGTAHTDIRNSVTNVSNSLSGYVPKYTGADTDYRLTADDGINDIIAKHNKLLDWIMGL